MAGFYAQLNSIIKERIAENIAIIERDELASSLDLSEVPREELEMMCSRAMASVMLYTNKYRSVVKGRGVFVHYEMAKNPKILKKLYDNADVDAHRKIGYLRLIENLMRDNSDGDYGNQMAFGLNDDNNLTIYEEMSKEELIDVLKDLIEAEG